MDEEVVKLDPRLQKLDCKIISFKDKKSTMIDKMCNVNCLYFEYFDFGCQMTISVSEYETGPFTDVVSKKFFSRTIHRKVKLGTLPCRFVKIVVHKGCLINPKSISAFGFPSEDTPDLFGSDVFSLLVAGP